MPEIIHLQTQHFELSIWCKNIEKRLSVYSEMLQKRDKELQEVSLCFSPNINLASSPILYEEAADLQGGSYPEIKLDTPLFFENLQYQIEWIFSDDIEDAWLEHRLQNVNDSFRFILPKGRSPARLTGVIHTANDVGWFRLPLCYKINGIVQKISMSFEILPTKMDLHNDIPAMYQKLDKTYPLWRFSLTKTTEQDVSKGKRRGSFPLLWLVNFASLREQLALGLKVIRNAPHQRLQTRISSSKAARLKGRIPHRLAEKVREDLQNGRMDRRYQIEKKFLSVDTPENRFVKMVVNTCQARLSALHQKLQSANAAPDQQRLSQAFLAEIQSWQAPLKKMKTQSFFHEVGAFTGLTRDSMVLQQKNGYSTVYRTWQELKFYLDVFANQTTVSMKSVAEIYEVWCFLALRTILTEKLQFKEVHFSNRELKTSSFFEIQLKDGLAGAFKFIRADGLKARLAHEPIFRKSGRNLRSYLVPQKPDILLEVSFPNGKHCIWLFDAKYRIKTKREYHEEGDIHRTDFAPDDAINQLHRYRDALIHIANQNQISQKTRPVFGAFALYPGYFDQEREEFPYKTAIEEVGIGAFPLLPSASKEASFGCLWLLQFLEKQLGIPEQSYLPKRVQEDLYMQDPVRIPYIGMKQSLYPDLIMTVALAGQKERSKEYLDAFEIGGAKWFHLPQKTFLDKYKKHVVEEIQFLAIATTAKNNHTVKQIDKLWPVRSVILQPRNQLTIEQSGKISKNTELYYLFELGVPLQLQKSVDAVPHRPTLNSMKLTTLSQLEKARVFREVENVYSEALIKNDTEGYPHSPQGSKHHCSPSK